MGVRLVDLAKNQLGLAAADAVVVGPLIVAELHHVPVGPLAAGPAAAGPALVREVLAVADAVALAVEHSTRRGARSECHVPSPPPTRRDLRVSLALLGRTWVKKNQEPPSPFLAGGTGRWAAVSAAGSVA